MDDGNSGVVADVIFDFLSLQGEGLSLFSTRVT